jgi:hypothetical protein
MSSNNDKSAGNENEKETNPPTQELTPSFAYRVLNTFKEDGSVRTKDLVKQYGGSPQWWASKIGTMKTSPKPYVELRRVGFSDSEVAQWVMRDSQGGKTEEPPAKTVDPQALEPKKQGTEPLIGQQFTGLEKSHSSQVAPPRVMTTQRPVTQKPRRAYMGYSESQLKSMDTSQLSQLGLVKSGLDGEIYIATQGENGRVILDPLPEAPPDPSLPPDGDPMIGVSMDVVNAEIAGIVKKIALSPMIHLSHGFAVGRGIFDGDLADFINFCVDFSCDKCFGFGPVIRLGHNACAFWFCILFFICILCFDPNLYILSFAFSTAKISGHYV